MTSDFFQEGEREHGLQLASPQPSRGQGSSSLALANHAGDLLSPLWREALPIGLRLSHPRGPGSKCNTSK